MISTDHNAKPHDAYAAFRVPEFRPFLIGSFLALLGSQMQTTAVAWEMYQRTGHYLDLGLVGLAQVIPVILLALPAGHLVDRFDRRKVICVAMIGVILTSVALAAISFWQADHRLVYVCLVLVGITRAFQQPAKSAMLPTLVPRDRFTNAVTWHTSGFQLATIAGPALGGVVLALTKSAALVYLLDAALAAFFFFMLCLLPSRPVQQNQEPVSLRSLAAGAAFVWRTKLILAAISLDMFAVLLGGATSLLPVFAKDIFHGDAEVLGWLRAAPGIGALVTSIFVAHLPPFRNSGRTLLLAVAGFGLATIIFGLSRNFWLAWSMLVITGTLDMVSVIIRHTLVQVGTPDEMRGRVSAVNGMFISISNELGAFESALVAQLFRSSQDPTYGPTVSVVSGGIGTIGIVLLTGWLFPGLRKLGPLDTAHSPPLPQTLEVPPGEEPIVPANKQ